MEYKYFRIWRFEFIFRNRGICNDFHFFNLDFRMDESEHKIFGKWITIGLIIIICNLLFEIRFIL